MPITPTVKAFDLRKYLGNGDGVKPYTEAQLAVMKAGSAILYLAIMKPKEEVFAEASRLHREHIKRFHAKPLKTRWRDGWK